MAETGRLGSSCWVLEQAVFPKTAEVTVLCRNEVGKSGGTRDNSALG